MELFEKKQTSIDNLFVCVVVKDSSSRSMKRRSVGTDKNLSERVRQQPKACRIRKNKEKVLEQQNSAVVIKPVCWEGSLSGKMFAEIVHRNI